MRQLFQANLKTSRCCQFRDNFRMRLQIRFEIAPFAIGQPIGQVARHDVVLVFEIAVHGFGAGKRMPMVSRRPNRRCRRRLAWY
jgi:hypothetical protein